MDRTKNIPVHTNWRLSVPSIKSSHPYAVTDTCKMSEHPPDRRPGRFLGHATARHRIGQPVLSFANVQKLKPVKNNFIVYFSSICQYFSSGCAGDTGLYAPKMSVHLPDPGPSRSSGRTTARQRIGQPVLLFAKVPEKFSVNSNFIVYFSDVCR